MEVKGIGLVPLYAITEFEGEYVADDSAVATIQDATSSSAATSRAHKQLAADHDPLAIAAKAGLMKTRNRNGQTWTVNPLFNQKHVRKTARRKLPTMRESLFRTIP